MAEYSSMSEDRKDSNSTNVDLNPSFTERHSWAEKSESHTRAAQGSTIQLEDIRTSVEVTDEVVNTGIDNDIENAEDEIYTPPTFATLPGGRLIYVNDPVMTRKKNRRIRNNSIRTTKYTPITFLPLNLLEQFSRVANFYFLCISALQQIPGVSPTNQFSTLGPLLIVLAVTALKEAYEDFKRFLSDNEVNNDTAMVVRGGSLEKVKWKNIRVGDIVAVNNLQPVPCDMVILSSTEPMGMCYVETAALDGETNLKLREALPCTASMKDPFLLSSFDGMLDCEKINPSLYTFTGTLHNNNQAIAVTPQQVVLRGSIVRNCETVYGLAVFTGKDTKLMQNLAKSRVKRSRVEREANSRIIAIVVTLIFIVLVCFICALWWADSDGRKLWYLYGSGTANFFTIFTFVVLFNNLIPISLYVSMELVKVFQASLIGYDMAMYDEESDTPAKARTSNLNEELGQISYIFSDKTGTLTRNVMEFRKCSVKGVSYGYGLTEIGIAAAKVRGEEVEEHVPTPESIKRAHFNHNPDLQFDDERFLDTVQDESNQQSEHLKAFLQVLSVCHTVIPEPDRADPTKIIYQAASPDEAALVDGAKALGYNFHTRDQEYIIINELGTDKRYAILNVCEFNSTRKRMSVVAQSEDGEIWLMTKGADTVIFPRLKEGQELETIEGHLEDFAQQGLRTLLLARKKLAPKQYEAWNKKFQEAATAMENREEKLDEAAELIETDLDLVGATAIEDKLQEGVPDTIEELAKANIKIWVLTGDKQETAINIGYACGLLHDDMDLIILDSEVVEDIKSTLKQKLSAYSSALHQDNEDLAIVVEGHTLRTILSRGMSMDFLRLAKACKACICCRVSPAQKAQVTSLVKENVVPKPITLSIGDGANDVSMIQAADVGVGISGKEGMQAARASDYSIAQFRFLKRLLLVHGAWSYRRLTMVILYSFYKNMTIVFTLLYFQALNGYTGQVIYESWLLACFNVIFTNLPIMLYGFLEQDISAKTRMKRPTMYLPGQKDEYFRWSRFWSWCASATYQSFLCMAIPAMVYDEQTALNGSGKMGGLWAYGTVVYTSVIIVVTLKLVLESSYFTHASGLVIVGSLASFFVVYMFWSGVLISGVTSDLYWVFYFLCTCPSYYMTVLLTVVVCLLPDYAVKAYLRQFRPKPLDIVQEAERSVAPEFTEELWQMLFPRKVRRFRYGKKQTHMPRNSTRRYTGFSFSQEAGQLAMLKHKSMRGIDFSDLHYGHSPGVRASVASSGDDTSRLVK